MPDGYLFSIWPMLASDDPDGGFYMSLERVRNYSADFPHESGYVEKEVSGTYEYDIISGSIVANTSQINDPHG